MNLWSSGMNSFVDMDGIYAVVKDVDSVADNSGLLLFAWIQDHFFEPHRLRDTATYVLRFLTCLSSDIICCLSADDVNSIKNEVENADVSDDDEDCLSYSVAFHVEKQEEQKDGIHCSNVSEIDIEENKENNSNVKLLKGSFPAVAIQKQTQTVTIKKVPIKRVFFPATEVSFADWLQEKKQSCSICLSPAIRNNLRVCEAVLRHMKRWPECDIQKCHDTYEISLREVEIQEHRAVVVEINEKRAIVLSLYNVLFETETQHNSSIVSEAIQSFRTWLAWAHVGCKVHASMMMKAELPNRLRKVLETMKNLFIEGQEDALTKILAQVRTNTHSQICREVEKLKKSVDGKSKCKKTSTSEPKSVNSDGNISELTEQNESYTFADRMADTMKSLQSEWWVGVESVLDTAERELFHKRVEPTKSKLKKQLDTAIKIAMNLAFDKLQCDLESSPGLKMTLKVNVRSGNIACEGEEECMEPPKVYVDLFKVDDIEDTGRSFSRMFRLGHIDLKPDENVLHLFTIKTKSILMVSIHCDQMLVHSINFQSGHGARYRQKPMISKCKSFGKIASFCDFDATNRSMAILHGETIGIFKFDENFRSMENIQKIDLSVRSTLTIPFVDLLLYDHAMTVTDGNGRSQTIHIHSQQTSTEVKIAADNDQDIIVKSQHFRLGDGLIVGCFILSKMQADDGAYEGKVQCVSCDDHRSLPSLVLPSRFLCDQIQVVCIGEKFIVLDPAANRIYVMYLEVTVRSEILQNSPV